MGAFVSVPPPPPPSPPPPPFKGADISNYSRIQSDYATVSMTNTVGKEIRDTQQALKPLRAKVAPAEDLEMERRKIAEDAKKPLIFIQLALFIVFLCLVCYVVLPQEWANGVSFLLLCVGVAGGFFLKGK